MSAFNKNEKEQILALLKDKIPTGYSLNGFAELQLDSDNYQVYTIYQEKIKILYLIILSDSLTTVHEAQVGRLCKKYDFQMGHYVKCDRDEKGISGIFVSSEIDKLK